MRIGEARLTQGYEKAHYRSQSMKNLTRGILLVVITIAVVIGPALQAADTYAAIVFCTSSGSWGSASGAATKAEAIANAVAKCNCRDEDVRSNWCKNAWIALAISNQSKGGWGSAWGASILFPYLLTVLRGQPTVSLASQMPFLVQLHVFSAFAGLAVLPFTRLSPFLVLALHRVLALGGRPVAAGFDAMESWLRKQNLAARIWPEED